MPNRDLRVPTDVEPIVALLWHRAMVGIALVEADGTFRHVNPTFGNLVEFMPNELEGKTFQSITHPDDVDKDVEAVKMVVSGHLPDGYVMRKRYLTKTGRTVWIKLKVDAVQKSNGSVYLLLAQVQALEPHVNGPTNAAELEPMRIIDRKAEVERAKRRTELVKWVVGMFVGAGLLIAGAYTGREQLNTLGSMLFAVAVGGAVIEPKVSKGDG